MYVKRRLVALAAPGARGARGRRSWPRRGSSLAIPNILAVACMLLLVAFSGNALARPVERASASSTGAQQADGGSYYPSVSGDDRYVALSSSASDLLQGDTNVPNPGGLSLWIPETVSTAGHDPNGANGRLAWIEPGPNGSNQIMLWRASDGRITKITDENGISLNGTEGWGEFSSPIGMDGDYVVWEASVGSTAYVYAYNAALNSLQSWAGMSDPVVGDGCLLMLEASSGQAKWIDLAGKFFPAGTVKTLPQMLSPQVWGRYVLWGSSALDLYDVVGGTTTHISTSADWPEIKDGYVVWWVDSAAPQGIHVYDLATGSQWEAIGKDLGDYFSDSAFPGPPMTGSGYIAWPAGNPASGKGSPGVYSVPLKTAVRPLGSDASLVASRPTISNGVIFWYETRSGSATTFLMRYDPSTRITSTVSPVASTSYYGYPYGVTAVSPTVVGWSDSGIKVATLHPAELVQVLPSTEGATFTSRQFTVPKGSSETVDLSPAAGYRVASVSDNGVDVTAQVISNAYTIASVTSEHIVASTYVAAPTITALDPTTSATAGGTSVVITGTGLTNVTAVTFGGTNATSYSVDPISHQITAVVPAHSAGTVQVQVTAAGGLTGDTPADDYTYAAPVALTRYKQSSTSLVYSGTWATVSTAKASGGSYKRSSSSAASVTIPFKGTQLDWIATKGTTMGKADVYLDNVFVTSIDLSATSASYQQNVWSTGTLPSGYHTVKILRRASNATGKRINIDRVDVAGTLVDKTRIEQTDSHLVWAPSLAAWTLSTARSASGGSYRYVNKAGPVTINFTGVSLNLIAKTAPSYGIATVSLDGGTPVPVKLYSSATAYKKTVWSSGFLPPGDHYVTFTWTGTKGKSTGGATIDIDAVDVRGVLN